MKDASEIAKAVRDTSKEAPGWAVAIIAAVQAEAYAEGVRDAERAVLAIPYRNRYADQVQAAIRALASEKEGA